LGERKVSLGERKVDGLGQHGRGDRVESTWKIFMEGTLG